MERPGLLPTEMTEATGELATWVIEREQMNEGRRLLRDSLDAERRAIVERIRSRVNRHVAIGLLGFGSGTYQAINAILDEEASRWIK